MTSILQATNDTTVSVLSTISTVAITTNGLVDTFASSLNMLNAIVRDASIKQNQRSIVDMSTFQDDLIKETSIQRISKDLEIKKILISKEINDEFKTHCDFYKLLLNPIKE